LFLLLQVGILYSTFNVYALVLNPPGVAL